MIVSQVFVGPQTYMVWALDDQGKIYVREAIFPDFPLGADWVAVTGITAVDLSVRSVSLFSLLLIISQVMFPQITSHRKPLLKFMS